MKGWKEVLPRAVSKLGEKLNHFKRDQEEACELSQLVGAGAASCLSCTRAAGIAAVTSPKHGTVPEEGQKMH